MIIFIEHSEHAVITSATNTHEKVTILAPTKTCLSLWIEGKRHNAATGITGFNNNTNQREGRNRKLM